MHRQSLGSPASKLHINGVKEDSLSTDEQKRKDQASSSLIDDDEEELKSQKKPHKSPERYIHFIPILTVLCFLILYLSSHDPSQRDLAQFSGFKRLSEPIDLREIDEFGKFSEVQRSDVLAIRSLRNLREINTQALKHRLHRKIGDF
ncbi:unnamed protein product [Ilex paraguariensis]|uniref:Uncharacterized protein n=1 Tax=Ilex paraguariensis TaxID=185542 RepID=A0ABC8R1H2_9AQUA